MALKFFQRLVLADWFWAQVGLRDFDEATARLFDERLLGESADGRFLFGEELSGVRYNARQISLDELREHDENLVRFWRQITKNPARHFEGRAPQLQYFQYLSCLFNAIYWRALFENRVGLCADLNAAAHRFNLKNPGEPLQPFEEENLDKLAFWMATGSGKTLLMHLHLLQLRAELERAQKGGKGGEPLTKVLLLTPSEELSAQHRAEFALSGLSSAPFSKTAGLFDLDSVATLEFSKLGEEMGDKRVALDFFAGRYLLLVDEAHRGLSGSKEEVKVWKRARDTMAAKGFCLEYSATFEQVVDKAAGEVNQEYARCIAFDYSYRRFYEDGYGKNFRVFNIEEPKIADARGKVSGAVGLSATAHTERYLCAALLSFAAQLRGFGATLGAPEMKEWGFEKPLWVFVGSSVTKETGTKELSDIEAILEFFAAFWRERSRFEAHFAALLSRQSGLVASGADPFALLFETLESELGTSGAKAYEWVARHVFGASADAGELRLSALKEDEGEIALSVGESAAWGVVNVGKASALLKKCEQNPRLRACVAPEKAIGASLFAGLAKSDSGVTVLIGARKFAAGWNSFRVSTLGLMNVGQSEGAQIIQLFGRGVRLRGFKGGLRRSAWANAPVPPALEGATRELETLGIFGLKSGYMKVFQEQLEKAGVSTQTQVSRSLKTQILPAPRPHLPTLVLPADRSFARSDARVSLCAGKVAWSKDGKWLEKQLPDDAKPIEADLYPKIAARLGRRSKTDDTSAPSGVGAQTQNWKAAQLDFLDYDALFSALHRYKSERGYTRLVLERDGLRALLQSSGWQSIKAEGDFWNGQTDWLGARALWQETALVLLKRRADLLWGRAKDDYEKDEHQLAPFSWETDKSLVREVAFSFPASDKQWPKFLDDLESQLSKTPWGALGKTSLQGLEILDFAPHLYRPLLGGVAGGEVSVKPAPLNAEEAQFLRDLADFAQKNPGWFERRRVFALRNKEKDGVGFYEKGGFYPDFLVWILEDGGAQTLAFVDPKGLRNLSGPNDRKVELSSRLQNAIEWAVNEGRAPADYVRLRSFLVSNTNWKDVEEKFGWDKTEAEAHGIFHQKDEPDLYIEKLLSAAVK